MVVQSNLGNPVSNPQSEPSEEMSLTSLSPPQPFCQKCHVEEPLKTSVTSKYDMKTVSSSDQKPEVFLAGTNEHWKMTATVTHTPFGYGCLQITNHP